GRGEGVAHGYWRPLIHRTLHQADPAQFGEPVGQHRVADPVDRALQLGKAGRTGQQGGQDDPVPALAQEPDGTRQGAVALTWVVYGVTFGRHEPIVSMCYSRGCY